MADSHPYFQEPPDLNVPLWRYFSFTKFVSLVSSKALFFPRADRLGDPFEGSLSQMNIQMRPEAYKDLIAASQKNPNPVDPLSHMEKFRQWVPQWTFISCWHMAEHESAAMWTLYGKSLESIAIKSTFQKLKDALPKEFYVGMVKYVDYTKDFIPEGDSFSPFLHKRRSYEHEREVRAITQDLPHSKQGITTGAPNTSEGRSVVIDCDSLIESIYISPGAPRWYTPLVNDVLKAFELSKPVYHSALDAKPVY